MRRAGTNDAAAVERMMIREEARLGLHPANADYLLLMPDLPDDRRAATVLLAAELELHHVVFVSFDDDPERFRACFVLAARHGNAEVIARGNEAVLVLRAPGPASASPQFEPPTAGDVP